MSALQWFSAVVAVALLFLAYLFRVARLALRDALVAQLRASQISGAQMTIDVIKQSIDSGTDIEELREGLDTGELPISAIIESRWVT